MLARDLMTPHPAVISADDSIADAADLMRTRGVGLLPVVDHPDRPRLVGVITDRDIVVRHVALGHGPDAKVRTHMTADPLVSAKPTSSMEEVTGLMSRYKVRRIPILDHNHWVVGIIAQADLAIRMGPGDPKLVERVVEAISSPGALVR